MKWLKPVSALALATLVVTVGVANASAATSPKKLDNKMERANAQSSTQSFKIIDPQQLKEEAIKDGLSLVKDGYHLSKIEYEYQDMNAASDATPNDLVNMNVVSDTTSNRLLSPDSWDTLNYYINSVTDYGSGWYNSSDDLVWDLWWDGPDTAAVEETRTYKATANTSLGVNAEGISASVGFTIGYDYSVKFSSTTPVPSTQKLNVKVFKTYQKKSYDVWENNAFSDDKFYATGWAYKPNGAYFMKAWYSL